MGINFSQLKGQGLLIFLFAIHDHFLKRSLTTKKDDIALLDTLGLFFVGCFSKVLFIKAFISYSNF